MVRHPLVAVGLVWSATAAATPAAAPAQAPREIALADALQAVGVAPAHRVAAAQQSEAEAAVAAAGAWPATVLSASTTRQTPRLDVAAALPLPIFGTLGANRDVARGDFAIAIAELRATDLQLARDVAVAWIALARAEARAELAARSSQREAELAHATEEKFAAGDASHADVVLASATAKRFAAQATADDAAIAVASAELAGLVGWEPTQRLHAGGGLPTAAPDAPVPAATVHPEQLAAQQREAAQAARVTEAARARWPHLALDLEGMFGDPTLPGTDYRVGLAVEVPLLGHTGAAVRAAEAKLATAQVSGAATRARLGAELAGARVRFAAAATHAASLAGDVLPAQREAAELARAAFREGQAGLVVALEAERGLAEAEGEAIDARAEAATAYVELEWASGEVR